MEKKKRLNLLDCNCRKHEGQFDMVDFPGDEFSVVKLYKHIEKHFMLHVSSNITVNHFNNVVLTLYFLP